MAGFKISDDSGPVAEINITPLVDVMLVLLIIFMVAAPMMETGIPLQLPKTGAKALPKEESPVILSITKESRLFIGREEIESSKFVPYLVEYFKSRKQKEIFVRADQFLPYGVVAQTMAMIKNAGIHKIGLVTLPGNERKEK